MSGIGGFCPRRAQLAPTRADLGGVDRRTPSVATIKVTCPTCGDLDLLAPEVRALVCSDDQTASYAFRCGTCRMMVVKPTEARIVSLLAASGVELVTWELPAEIHEPHSGPAITWDDLLEFHFRINEEGAMVRALTELGDLRR